MFKRQMKAICAVLLLLVAILAAGVASAQVEFEDRATVDVANSSDQPDLLNAGSELPAEVVRVEVNGDEVETGTGITERIDRGQELEVKIRVEAQSNVNDVQVLGILFGDERFLVSDSSGNFDLDANERSTVTLRLQVPDVFESDSYYLRVILAGRTGFTKSYNYPIHMDQQRHQLVVEDVFFSSNGGKARAGRSLLPIVRVKNLGEQDEQDVRVEAAIPQLGVNAVDFIDQIDVDEEESSEELFLTIPADARAGHYDMVITVKYDEQTRTETRTVDVEVVGSPRPAQDQTDDDSQAPARRTGRTIVSVGSESQDVVQGEGGAIYPVTLTNDGSTSKSYTLGVSGADTFATVEISPSNVVVLSAGETETAYVYVSAKEDAATGSHPFTVDIKSGDQVLQQVPLTANVVEPASEGFSGLTRGLEIAVIVIVIILVIVGLIVAFTRARKGDEEEEETTTQGGQTYY